MWFKFKLRRGRAVLLFAGSGQYHSGKTAGDRGYFNLYAGRDQRFQAHLPHCLFPLKTIVKAEAKREHAHAPFVTQGIIPFFAGCGAKAELIEADIFRAEHLRIVAIG